MVLEKFFNILEIIFEEIRLVLEKNRNDKYTGNYVNFIIRCENVYIDRYLANFLIIVIETKKGYRTKVSVSIENKLYYEVRIFITFNFFFLI